MRRLFLFLVVGCVLAAGGLQAQTVSIHVDAQNRQGPLRPIWSFFGYDEANYTYMKDGKKLLSELAELSPVPVYVRTHFLLATGDGTPGLKWSSTNAYTEDANGKPRYDWTIIDKIFDTYIERKMKPLVEIGFMPEALSSKPEPYRTSRPPQNLWSSVGAAYPPKDYDKWSELIYQWVKHSVDRYGKQEVESWWWEVWNEPNISYWRGTPEEYFKLYDYAAAGLKRALPTARIGGPHSTGPADPKAAAFLRSFLDHVLHGKNYATGKTGSPLDYVGFHAKGRPQFENGLVIMGIQNQLQSLEKGFEVISSFPELKGRPVIIGESDPEGCAACSARFNPQNGYRNGIMYASYMAAVMPRHLDLAAKHNVNLIGAVTWAFEFENQPYFDGFRDLATNGIDKPVLNTLRMLGKMRGDRVAVQNPAAIPLDQITANGVRSQPDVYAVASRDANSVAILVSNYQDSEEPGPAADIALTITGLPSGRMTLHHYRVDNQYSNSFEKWKKMGSPQKPTPAQYSELEQSGKLQTISEPTPLSAEKGTAKVSFSLPLHGVSLIQLTW